MIIIRTNAWFPFDRPDRPDRPKWKILAANRELQQGPSNVLYTF